MRSIKKELDIRMFKHNEVISDVTNEGHPNFSQRKGFDFLTFDI